MAAYSLQPPIEDPCARNALFIPDYLEEPVDCPVEVISPRFVQSRLRKPCIILCISRMAVELVDPGFHGLVGRQNRPFCTHVRRNLKGAPSGSYALGDTPVIGTDHWYPIDKCFKRYTRAGFFRIGRNQEGTGLCIDVAHSI